MADFLLASLLPAAGIVVTDSSRVQDLDEVIVISQAKEFFNLRQQPLSSTMFTTDETDRLGVRDLRDLSQFVPSFAMPNYGLRYTSSMYVRGIGSRINSPAVGVYYDNIPLMSKAAFNNHFCIPVCISRCWNRCWHRVCRRQPPRPRQPLPLRRPWMPRSQVSP